MSLRIAAIRETFEESGILVLGKRDTLIGEADLPSKSEVQNWRTIVRNNPLEFYNMCLELEAVPQLNSLYEWSNWLSPVMMPKRFDVMFFLTALTELPRRRF